MSGMGGKNSSDKTTSLNLGNEVQFLCFTLEEENSGVNQLYAMNVFKIREIIYYDHDFTETVGDNNGIMLGYLTVRNETIPLIDMRRWLYYSKEYPDRDLRDYSLDTDKNLVIICSFSNKTVGLKIREVKRIIHKNWDDVSVGMETGVEGNSKVTATTKYDDGSVIQILDIEMILDDSFFTSTPADNVAFDSLESIESEKVVLLAEDSKVAVKSLQLIMEKLELKYFSFSNGKALLDYLYSPGVSVGIGAVITDIEMPEMSGFELLRQIKETPSTSHIPVIINSSMSNEGNLQEAENLKADGFITKSNPSEIEKTLRQFLIDSRQ